MYCKPCNSEIFPFNGLSNDREFRDAILGFSLNEGDIGRASQLRFNPLDSEIRDALAGLNETLGGCQYYNDEQFRKFKDKHCKNKSKKLSLLCHNINGMPKKIDQFEVFLKTLDFTFDVIGITETHFNEASCKLATLKGYTSVANSRRVTDNWGGVAIYLRDSYLQTQA